jgi:hypothetical protein
MTSGKRKIGIDPLSVSFSDQKEKVVQALQQLSVLEKLVSENCGI